MTTQLKYTLDQVRDRAVAQLDTRGIPNDWWPWKGVWDEQNDCIKFVLTMMGVCTRSQQDNHFTSIGAFLGWAGWDRLDTDDVRPGDIALENWSSPHTTELQHAELVYSVVGDKVTTISANTSPAPGVEITEKNRGVYKKTRTIGSDWLREVVRPPYKNAAATVTPNQKTEARLVAAYVNRWRDIDKFPRTATQEDGIPGPIYWRLVQSWGRANKVYGTGYIIDGIPGPRTRAVEKIIYAKAKAVGK